jgi:RNA polymerase sigma factor (sigma-70 family)
MSDEVNVIEAARSGDQDAFAQLVGPYRARLQAHCYRMLGSLPDADDALQETLLRAWRGLARFEGRSSLQSWLYTIATNTSLRAIEKRPARVLPVDYAQAANPFDQPAEALTEPVWLDPFPDAELRLVTDQPGPDARYEQRESIELAFTATLQYLPARQRAVLILRDVLGFSARETAEALGTTSACPCPRSRAGTRAATQSASSSVCGPWPHSGTSGSPPSPPAASRLSPPTSGTRRWGRSKRRASLCSPSATAASRRSPPSGIRSCFPGSACPGSLRAKERQYRS